MSRSRFVDPVAGRTLTASRVARWRLGGVGPPRVARIAFAVGALTFAPGAGTAHASFLGPISSFVSQGSGDGHFRSPLGNATAQASLLSPVNSFGSQGSGAGQFQSPLGVAIQASSGNVYVVDSGNARVEKFFPDGSFISAFGQGQLSSPRGIATDTLGKVYVSDAGTNTVQKFDANGNFVSTIDGTGAPQGHFQSLGGVAVDQANNLWVADSGTSNVIDLNSKGMFRRQRLDSCPSSGPV